MSRVDVMWMVSEYLVEHVWISCEIVYVVWLLRGTCVDVM